MRINYESGYRIPFAHHLWLTDAQCSMLTNEIENWIATHFQTSKPMN